jgi:pilus assembly protein FimV
MRRKKFQQFEDSIITGTNLQANSVFGQTGGQSVDTNSMFNSTFGPVTTSALDSNEVDPIAEADVYIAYGRQAQAEEILKEALRRDPERQSVRLKLIELTAQRGDVKAVETLAGEMYAMTNGDCEEWPRVLSVGAAVDPNNPMYANAQPAVNVERHEDTMPMPIAADQVAGAMVASSLDPEETVKLPNGINVAAAADLPLEMADTTPAPLDIDLDLTKDFAAPADAPALDLDLDVPSIAPVLEAEASPVAPADSNTLDFDLGFDLPASSSAPTAAAVEAVTNDLAMPDLSIDLPMEMSSTSAPAVSAAESSANDGYDAGGLDFDLGDLDVPSLADHAKVQAASEELKIDLPALEPLAETADATPVVPAAPALPDFDAAGLDLDLPAVADAAPATDALDVGADGDMPSHWQEIATKLDLAKAYIDIGDKEGAQELLDEVVDAGDAAQKAKAQEMLATLA